MEEELKELRELVGDSELARVIRIVTYSHDCSRARKYRCCNEWRCKGCHEEHIRVAHKERQLWLLNEPRPMDNGRSVEKEKEPKPTKPVQKKQKASVTFRLEDLSPDQLEELFGLLLDRGFFSEDPK
jgi:hypothetical protein